MKVEHNLGSNWRLSSVAIFGTLPTDNKVQLKTVVVGRDTTYNTIYEDKDWNSH